MVEFLRVAQPSHGPHADLIGLPRGRGLLSHLPRGYLHILFAQGAGHVRGSQVAFGQPHWIKPEPHGIFALAKDNYVAHALHALDGIADVKIKVVADKQAVILVFVRIKTERHNKRASVLADAHARGLHFNGQASQRGGSAVLHIDRSNVQVAVKIKGSADGTGAVIAAGGAYVAHAFGAVDGLFQQGGHAGFHRL